MGADEWGPTLTKDAENICRGLNDKTPVGHVEIETDSEDANCQMHPTCVGVFAVKQRHVSHPHHALLAAAGSSGPVLGELPPAAAEPSSALCWDAQQGQTVGKLTGAQASGGLCGSLINRGDGWWGGLSGDRHAVWILAASVPGHQGTQGDSSLSPTCVDVVPLEMRSTTREMESTRSGLDRENFQTKLYRENDLICVFCSADSLASAEPLVPWMWMWRSLVGHIRGAN